MPTVPPVLTHLLAILLLIACAPACAYTPDATRLERAAREGKVVVYAATDQSVVQPLIDDFHARHPGVRVEYHDINSSELYSRIISEAEDGGIADVAWSSAMDLQVKLVNDGYAQPHRSRETEALPDWAVWKNEAFGTTYEPAAIIFNKRLLHSKDIPQTHAALLRIVSAGGARWRGRIVTYDPAQSGVGMLLHSQDAQANPSVFWQLAQAFGDNHIVLDTSTNTMIDRIARGDALIGYNLLGSYAYSRARTDGSLGVIWPQDYTLVLTRVAFITRKARHPEAARLWLDHLLSAHGQALLADRAGLFSVREDAERLTTAAGLRRQLGTAFRPIALGSGLLTYLDQAKQRAFLRRWTAALGEGAP